MKITTVLAPLIAAVTAVNAKALLAVFEDEVTIGKTYKVEWLSDEKQVRTDTCITTLNTLQ